MKEVRLQPSNQSRIAVLISNRVALLITRRQCATMLLFPDFLNGREQPSSALAVYVFVVQVIHPNTLGVRHTRFPHTRTGG